MPKSMCAAVATLALFAGAPSLAFADSIKDLVPESALADFCGTAGIGSETTVSLELADGSDVTGTIHCEAEDLVVGDVDDADAGAADALDGDDGGNDASDDNSDDGDRGDSDNVASDDSDNEESGDANDSGSEDSDDGDGEADDA